MARNGQKRYNKLSFLPKGKKASAEGRSPPQELEVGPRSGRIFCPVYLTVSVSGGGKGIGGESGENCAVFGRKSSPAKSGENRRPHRTDRYQLCRSALYTQLTQSVNRIFVVSTTPFTQKKSYTQEGRYF